jgi:hypothetical protein
MMRNDSDVFGMVGFVVWSEGPQYGHYVNPTTGEIVGVLPSYESEDFDKWIVPDADAKSTQERLNQQLFPLTVKGFAAHTMIPF